jgi:hypothetical protein
MSEPFVIETAEDGVTPIRYSCQELMENNQMSFLSVEYYYDIMYDAGEDEAAVVAKAESDLLSKVAANFGIISGDRCQIPAINDLWVVEVTSRPEDEYISVFSKSVVKGSIEESLLFFMVLI